ncbi:hypothetical protein [Simiduia agarivorans]|uniref:Uncharacterized protein n=1 Tax=Simiduia agarivorans (strain DSM 21679 / JCM 13881 / BCRC 17597 / SA1) TaxID=1117647 RepID=K4KP89_SIMAS|nr:hypothetical protein [Simiduia agarivorans]AFU99828.1 hypothetical protein M5M_13420 [Simiduia agarivorans SA1 = DSM 21679]AFU99933.1 hypothetical protein M5M_13975 [Simiduia agarivorans SA1 = DSM 21679]
MSNIANALLGVMGWLEILEAEELDEDMIVKIQEELASAFAEFTEQEREIMRVQANSCLKESVEVNSPPDWINFYKNVVSNYGLED